MPVSSIECAGVNSNYTFLLDYSQPETGKERVMDGCLQYSEHVQAHTDTQAGHESPAGEYCLLHTSLETHKSSPLRAPEIALTNSHSLFLAKHSLKMHQQRGRK